MSVSSVSVSPWRGGLLRTTPRRFFFQIARKQERVAPSFSEHLFIHSFHICSENFRPRSLKVRSPAHVKWPHLTKSLYVLKATPTEPSPWNVQRLIHVTISIKCLYQNLDISDLRSDQFCDFSINKLTRQVVEGIFCPPLVFLQQLWNASR